MRELAYSQRTLHFRFPITLDFGIFALSQRLSIFYLTKSKSVVKRTKTVHIALYTDV